jgi:hypothetical protein
MADLKSSLVSGLNIAVRLIGQILRIAIRWSKKAMQLALPWAALVAVRLASAFLAFWSALLDPDFRFATPNGAAAAGKPQTRVQGQTAAPARAAPPPPRTAQPAANAATLDKAPPDSALLLLGLFQKEGRLVDFLQEDVTQYADEDVGAAARVVHTGCRTVLAEYLTIVPVRDEPEGSYVTLNPGFDAAATRPTGNVVGEPPFTGSLVHRGWRATQVRLPQVASGRDLRILAAAEVEL